jgi:hypothetical protein
MTNKHLFNPIAPTRRFLYLAAVLVVAVSGGVPLLSSRHASAAQLNSRSLTISSAVPGGTNVTYSYAFTTQTGATPIQSIKFIACTTAVDTYGRASSASTTGCTAPTGLNINQGTQQGTNTFTNTTAFARNASGAGFCTPGNNVLCLDRTQAANESAGAKTIAFNTQTNPSTANSSFFIGVYLYQTSTWGTPHDNGTVASAVTQTLTVNAAVAEVLNFCVGSTTVNDATSDVTGAGADDCTGVSGTDVNLGTLDTSAVNVSPVSSNGGDSDNGVAVIRTNAPNGASVYYDAIQQTGTNHQGTLRVGSAVCNAGNVVTDQCIDAAGGTQTAFSAGTEKFGMSIGAVNCSLNPGTAYTCTFSSGAYNLVRDTNYDCTGNNTFNTSCSQGYAWVEDGTPTLIATSASSATKVIDDEALLLKFAATPSITTPFGAYAAQADLVAVATY